VVETLVNGLAGSVRIPAPGTGISGDDQALRSALLGSPTTELIGRGWPGVGFAGVDNGLRPGFRSRQSAARSAAQWVFGITPSGATAPVLTSAINIAAGQSLADIQRAVDSALQSTSNGRIGVCVLGPDGTLYVEGNNASFMLQVSVGGSVLGMVAASRPGETPERMEEPAIDLRRTDETRTFRFMRDRLGRGVETDFDDVGWVRMSADPTNGSPTWSIVFPHGRYWLSVRPDAARTTGYDASGQMVVSGGVDPADSTRAFVHRAHYWVAFQDCRPLGITRNSAGEFMLDLLWG
jgi:hypothetical protein